MSIEDLQKVFGLQQTWRKSQVYRRPGLQKTWKMYQTWRRYSVYRRTVNGLRFIGVLQKVFGLLKTCRGFRSLEDLLRFSVYRRPEEGLRSVEDLKKVLGLWKTCRRSSAFRRPVKDLGSKDNWKKDISLQKSWRSLLRIEYMKKVFYLQKSGRKSSIY